MEYEEAGNWLLRNWFWSDTEPGVFCHPYAFIVLLPDLETLEPISRTLVNLCMKLLMGHAYFLRCSGNWSALSH
jgi:hypothetical protein